MTGTGLAQGWCGVSESEIVILNVEDGLEYELEAAFRTALG